MSIRPWSKRDPIPEGWQVSAMDGPSDGFIMIEGDGPPPLPPDLLASSTFLDQEASVEDRIEAALIRVRLRLEDRDFTPDPEKRIANALWRMHVDIEYLEF